MISRMVHPSLPSWSEHMRGNSPEMKTTNYIQAVLLQKRKKAWRRPPDGSVVRFGRPHCLECTGSNVFVVKDGEDIHNAPAATFLFGITRKLAIDLAKKEFPLGKSGTCPVEELFCRRRRRFSHGLFQRKIVPIVSIDGKTDMGTANRALFQNQNFRTLRGIRGQVLIYTKNRSARARGPRRFFVSPRTDINPERRRTARRSFVLWRIPASHMREVAQEHPQRFDAEFLDDESGIAQQIFCPLAERPNIAVREIFPRDQAQPRSGSGLDHLWNGPELAAGKDITFLDPTRCVRSVDRSRTRHPLQNESATGTPELRRPCRRMLGNSQRPPPRSFLPRRRAGIFP